MIKKFTAKMQLTLLPETQKHLLFRTLSASALIQAGRSGKAPINPAAVVQITIDERQMEIDFFNSTFSDRALFLNDLIEKGICACRDASDNIPNMDMLVGRWYNGSLVDKA